MRVRFYEWLVGKLIVRSAKLRAHRCGPDDAHELRHLLAAITAGNSSPCGGGECHLDKALMQRLHDANWPPRPIPEFGIQTLEGTIPADPSPEEPR